MGELLDSILASSILCRSADSAQIKNNLFGHHSCRFLHSRIGHLMDCFLPLGCDRRKPATHARVAT